jgi:hypothetical protein
MSQIDSDIVKKRIADILTKIQTEANPQELNEYRSVFKKEVSFFSRSYVAAYLLMQLDRGKAGRSFKAASAGGDGSRGGRFRKFSRSSEESPRGEPKNYPLAEEDSVRLFVGVGRSRKVFPREILGLINTKTAISKDDIGAIRILDNYSFVQVRNTVADTIIDALNGKPFRGKILSVNYARNRKDEGQEFPDNAETPDSGLSGPEAVPRAESLAMHPESRDEPFPESARPEDDEVDDHGYKEDV